MRLCWLTTLVVSFAACAPAQVSRSPGVPIDLNQSPIAFVEAGQTWLFVKDSDQVNWRARVRLDGNGRVLEGEYTPDTATTSVLGDVVELFGDPYETCPKNQTSRRPVRVNLIVPSLPAGVALRLERVEGVRRCSPFVFDPPLSATPQPVPVISREVRFGFTTFVSTSLSMTLPANLVGTPRIDYQLQNPGNGRVVYESIFLDVQPPAKR